ncbi:MAG: sulfotransferase [Myxococcales bacterium]|nr:sulfotransferase [Myxococcales bacterium]
MKTQLRSVLFGLVLPILPTSLVACGSDDHDKTSNVSMTSFLPKLEDYKQVNVVADAPKADPVPTVKVVIDEPIPTSYDAAMTQGRALAEKGENARAREMFEAAIKLDKKKADPHIELARLFIATNDKGMAVVAANRAVKLAPMSSQAWNTKGRAELNRFEYDKAIEAFTKSVELNADNVWAWNNLGFTELQLKKYDVAAEHFAEAASRKGATGYMFNNLGTALEQLDRLDEARKAFDAGATLGSKEAVSSRKRLEGVKSIAIAKEEHKDKVEKLGQSYELDEGQPATPTAEDKIDTSDPDADVQTPGEGSGSGSSSDQSTM